MASDKQLAATVKAVDLSALPRTPITLGADLPVVPCVYFVFLGTRLMYIGTAVNLNQRIKTHHLRHYKRKEFEQSAVAWWGTRGYLTRVSIHFTPSACMEQRITAMRLSRNSTLATGARYRGW